MFSLAPGHTPYDLHFSVLGFPVRVHPLFWIMGLVMGWQFGDGIPIYVLISVCVIFVSILIHELGHALMMRRFGREAHIVLYLMGGLAIEGSDNPYSFGSFRSSYGSTYRGRTTWEQIWISFAGPGAGFILAALVIGIVYLVGGHIVWKYIGGAIPHPVAEPVTLEGIGDPNANLYMLFDLLLWFNVVWGLVNLVPVYPLDGGQIAQAALVAQDPYQGLTKSLWLSVFAGAGMAIAGALLFKSMYMVLLFGSLAYGSYVALQQIGGGRGRPW